MKKLAALALALLATLGRPALADDRSGLAAIDEGSARAAVETLAGDAFAGREAGSEGGRKASEWIATELAKLGLEPAGDDGTYFQSFKVGAKSLRNVVASLPARKDSDVADEVVVVGSHYDHLGHGAFGALDFLSGRGKVHHGADDNASGSAGNLLLARACSAAGPARRRIVFVWFDGEELGLFGSKRYVKAPPFPLEKTVAMLNMDMIGRLRNEKLTVYGLNTGSTFPGLCREAAEGLGFRLDVREALPPNSDHFSFYEKKVPVVALFTGLHRDYHRATDTVEKIEVESLTRIARLAYGIVRGLASADERAAFARAKDGNAEALLEQIQAMLGDDELQKLFGGENGLQKLFEEGGIGKVLERLRGSRGKPRFGVSVQETADGVVVERVTPASVAERAGVRTGDVVVSFDGRPVGDYAGLTAAIREARGKVRLAVRRDGETVELSADFGAEGEAPKKRWL